MNKKLIWGIIMGVVVLTTVMVVMKKKTVEKSLTYTGSGFTIKYPSSWIPFYYYCNVGYNTSTGGGNEKIEKVGFWPKDSSPVFPESNECPLKIEPPIVVGIGEGDVTSSDQKYWEIAKQFIVTYAGDENVQLPDWKTYKNEQFGFELKYPKDWHVDDNLTLTTCCLNITSYSGGAERLFSGQTKIQIQHYTKPTSQSLTNFASQPDESLGRTSPKVETETVAGIQGVKSNAIGDGVYFLPKSETEGIRIISWSHLDTKEASQAFIQQILSTFKFTK